MTEVFSAKTTGINNDRVKWEIIPIEKEESIAVSTKAMESIYKLNTKNIKSRETGESCGLIINCILLIILL